MLEYVMNLSQTPSPRKSLDISSEESPKKELAVHSLTALCMHAYISRLNNLLFCDQGIERYEKICAEAFKSLDGFDVVRE
jgi:hypothetical protein